MTFAEEMRLLLPAKVGIAMIVIFGTFEVLQINILTTGCEVFLMPAMFMRGWHLFLDSGLRCYDDVWGSALISVVDKCSMHYYAATVLDEFRTIDLAKYFHDIEVSSSEGS